MEEMDGPPRQRSPRKSQGVASSPPTPPPPAPERAVGAEAPATATALVQRNRRRPRGLLERVQLFYSERVQEPDGRVAPVGGGAAPPTRAPKRASARVVPADAAAPPRRVEVALSSAYALEVTTTILGTGVRRVKAGPLAEALVRARWPNGGFVRGIVESETDGLYTIAYVDGPYAYNDARAPPPGHDDGGWLARRLAGLGVDVRRTLTRVDDPALEARTVRLLRVPAALVAFEARAPPRRLHFPVAILALTAAQILAFAFWGRVDVGLEGRHGRTPGPGPRPLFFSIAGQWPHCADQRGQAWRLASYQLVHVSWQHVLFNALIQVVFGAPIEVTHGSLALVAVYELGVVFGALACALTDTFDVVVGASGGTYALLGAHLSAIYKDWDRLKHGILNRRVRMALFIVLILTDVMFWVVTRQEGVSYSAHIGGAATGLLLGVLILRRRPSRRGSAFLPRLKRPTFVLTLLAYVGIMTFSVWWYATVWPPRPVSFAWYSQKDRDPRSRKCCFQLLTCGIEPGGAFNDLSCNYNAGKFRITKQERSGVVDYGACSDLEAYARNSTFVPGG